MPSGMVDAVDTGQGHGNLRCFGRQTKSRLYRTVHISRAHWTEGLYGMKIAFVGSCGGHFRDNCKYAFLHATNSEAVEPVFVTGISDVHLELTKHGLPAHLVKGADHSFWETVSAVVVDNGHGVDPAKPILQLWHGVGPKIAGRAQESIGSVRLDTNHLAGIKAGYSGYRLIATTGRFCAAMFNNYFYNGAYALTGLPRNDVLFRAAAGHDWLMAAAPQVEWKKKLVLIAPTFRENGSAAAVMFASSVIRSYLRNLDATVLVKLHPFEAVPKEVPSNLIILPSDADCYPLMNFVNVLVTDVSSIASDFALLDRPIIHFMPDFEQYLSTCRDMAYDPRIFNLGPWVASAEDLCDAISGALSGNDPESAQRRRVVSLLHEFNDGHSSARALAAAISLC